MPAQRKWQERDAYARWRAVPGKVRPRLGLPSSEAAFARLHNVSVKALQNWRIDPEWIELHEQYLVEYSDSVPTKAVKRQIMPTEIDEVEIKLDTSKEEQSYLDVKERLIDMALGGNQGAIDMYLKHFGKAFIEADNQDLADYSQLSSQQLVAETLEFIGVELVSKWLASKVAHEK